MLRKGSRYQDVAGFTAGGNGLRFAGLRARPIEATPGILEHVVQAGDRLDLLARHYYNDDRLWWRIADANPEYLLAGRMLAPEMVGRVILIPAARP